MRARNRLRIASAGLQFLYDAWIKRVERSTELRSEFQRAAREWTWRPQFSILLYARSGYTAEELSRSIESVENQIYSCSSLIGPANTIEGKIAAADAEFVIPLRIGDMLSEVALFRFAEALQTQPNGALLYGDHDHLDDNGRRTCPWFKPRWNEEMFLAQDYLSPAVAIKADLAQRISEDGPQNPDTLLLPATSAAEGAIVHVPHILCHVDSRTGEQGRIDAIARHLQVRGATCSPGPFNTVKVAWPLPDPLPLVTIIIPTKDKLDLLRPCLDSILRRTEYPNYEVLIVDNGSVDVRTARYLADVERDPRIRVLSYPGTYNFSAINNFAVREAQGSHLCLLNNDTEVIAGAWLTEMMRYSVRFDVGAVGAKLLYDDGTIQHAGVVVGIGEAAGHAHRFLPADRPGYFRMAHVAQFVSAVTAACLVVDKRKFMAVGGLDEERFAVAFNDVDFCLKLKAAGWRNVYVPHAVLFHHESKSRGLDSSPTNVERFRRELQILQSRWGTKGYEDPHFSPNLDPRSETFVIAS